MCVECVYRCTSFRFMYLLFLCFLLPYGVIKNEKNMYQAIEWLAWVCTLSSGQRLVRDFEVTQLFSAQIAYIKCACRDVSCDDMLCSPLTMDYVSWCTPSGLVKAGNQFNKSGYGFICQVSGCITLERFHVISVALTTTTTILNNNSPDLRIVSLLILCHMLSFSPLRHGNSRRPA